MGSTPGPETTRFSGDLAPGLSAEGITDRAAGGDAWGPVHRCRFEATGVGNGSRVRRTETLEATSVGATRVTRPPWYAEATKNTSKR
ncbi:hypothetical protein [Haladaptatus salinisoli]|uniref:hypothetical protein n=1 Tax=Haladaptatus salinisoli TaxID=2884876 RepID=UPI001D09DF23|nr:hypothetical protein [Haladaptatus salinisoli]